MKKKSTLSRRTRKGNFAGEGLSPDDAPWLGLHLEQQTVMLNAWTKERAKMREEIDELRRMLEDAENTIRELEKSSSPLARNSIAPECGTSEDDERESVVSYGVASVTSTATTVLAGSHAGHRRKAQSCNAVEHERLAASQANAASMTKAVKIKKRRGLRVLRSKNSALEGHTCTSWEGHLTVPILYKKPPNSTTDVGIKQSRSKGINAKRDSKKISQWRVDTLKHRCDGEISKEGKNELLFPEAMMKETPSFTERKAKMPLSSVVKKVRSISGGSVGNDSITSTVSTSSSSSRCEI